jgi:thioredoxin reductase (NADPH)
MLHVDLLVVGAGPAGIAVASEARAAGIAADRVAIVEKGMAHSTSIRSLYPHAKPVTANYKGIEARCEGLLCIADTTKDGTLSYLDEAIDRWGLRVHYGEQVHDVKRAGDGGFEVATNRNDYTARVVVIAIGVFGRPNKPSYKIPRSLRNTVSFDVTSTQLEGKDVLVVGGGDSASEYCQHLLAQRNEVTLSYRQAELSRMHPGNRKAILKRAAAGKLSLWLESDVEQVRDLDGRPEAVFSRGPLAHRAFDHIVYALGGTTPVAFLHSVGIELADDLPVFRRGYETNVPGLYLAGDLVAGKNGGSIVAAFNASRRVMEQVCTDHLGCSLAPTGT